MEPETQPQEEKKMPPKSPKKTKTPATAVNGEPIASEQTAWNTGEEGLKPGPHVQADPPSHKTLRDFHVALAAQAVREAQALAPQAYAVVWRAVMRHALASVEEITAAGAILALAATGLTAQDIAREPSAEVLEAFDAHDPSKDAVEF